MARCELKLCLMLVIAAMMCAPSSAQATQASIPTLPALPNCPPAQITLSPCISYIFGVGSSPLSSCCSQLQAFFESQGPCLCAASKFAPGQLGLFFGQAQAMLPNICNMPSNTCDDPNAPTAATPSVATTPPATPSVPTAPVSSVVTTTPTTPLATPATPTTNTPSTTPTNPDETEASPVTANDSPTTTTASDIGSKISALLHSAGAQSSRDMATANVLIALLFAYVSTMYV